MAWSSGSGYFVGKLATIVLDTATDYPGPMGAIRLAAATMSAQPQRDEAKRIIFTFAPSRLSGWPVVRPSVPHNG
eukprot:1328315-Rhodomonas_salina.1